MTEELEFFVIKSKDEKYFRAKGFGGYGDSWVSEIKRARVYQKIGPARSQVTFWASNYPEYGIPDIMVLTVSATRILDGESDRVKKAILKKAKSKVENDLYNAKENMKQIQQRMQHDTQRILKNAQEKVRTLEELSKTL